MNLNYDWLPIFGDPTYRGECAKEDAELVTGFNYIRKIGFSHRIYHVENEGKKNFVQVTKSKMKGELKGVSDINGVGMPPLALEVKRRDHTQSQWQSGQLEYLKTCHDYGYFVGVCLGYEGIIEAVEKWSLTQPH